MVRLVKGAYWDSEIKRAQVDGLDGFPVFTRKLHTDVSYLACARKLLAAPDAVFPQFATHNAYTVAAIHSMAGEAFRPGEYEFQCLHGMGEPLYDEVVGHNRWTARAASTPPSARTRRCWPTWCAACWRTAPTPPSSTASRTRRPARGARRRPGGQVAASLPVGAPHERIALPRDLFAPGAPTPPGSTSATSDGSPPWPPPCARARADWRAAPDGGERRARAGGAQPRRPTRPGGPRRRGDAGAGGRRAGPGGGGRAPVARRPRRTSARPACGAPRTCWRRACPRCSGWSCARPASPRPTPSARCARRWTSCATTPPRRAHPGGAGTARSARWRASRRGTSRWRSSPGRWRPRWRRATRCWPSRRRRRR